MYDLNLLILDFYLLDFELILNGKKPDLLEAPSVKKIFLGKATSLFSNAIFNYFKNTTKHKFQFHTLIKEGSTGLQKLSPLFCMWAKFYAIKYNNQNNQENTTETKPGEHWHSLYPNILTIWSHCIVVLLLMTCQSHMCSLLMPYHLSLQNCLLTVCLLTTTFLIPSLTLVNIHLSCFSLLVSSFDPIECFLSG